MTIMEKGSKGSVAVFLCLAVAVSLLRPCVADEESHVYSQSDPVVLWVNKIGPYHNPQETYSYYRLPFCRGPRLQPERKSGGIGEVLEGNELINSDIPISFKVPTPKATLCKQKLDVNDAEAFHEAIQNHYWYQLYIDDLPVWGLVGKTLDERDEKVVSGEIPAGTHVLYTHKRFNIMYNSPNVIQVNLTYTDVAVPINLGSEIEFTYEVDWLPTEVSFEDRFDRYLEEDFFEHQIHWFSIFNSFMMVIFLCGLVGLILIRTLRNDYAKYMRDEDDLDHFDKGMGDETGWKQIRGDVFRKPEHLMLLAALLGTGQQLAVLVLCVILFAIIGSLYVEPGGMISASIACYALSAVVAGYSSGGFYRRYFYPHPASKWVQTMILTVSLLPSLIFVVVFFINWIAVYYGTTYAIPFGTIVKIFLIWAFVSFPLAVVGTVLGRNWNGKPDFPCRVNRLPRPIPEGPWYTKVHTIILVTGVLPFGSIFIEMYFIFTSFWNYKFYYVYGFMLLIFCILVVVTICVTIVAMYFLLSAENWRWHWIAFASAGSSAVYVFCYSVYFYFFKTRMLGFLQTAYYFAYMLLFCIAFSIMCGSVGYFGSEIFVRRIYRNIKSE